MMRSLLQSTLIIIGALFIFTSPIIAVGETNFCDTAEGKTTSICQGYQDGKTKDPLAKDGIFSTILSVIAWLVGIASVVGVVIGGYKYTFSGGDATKTASGRSMIIYSLIGLVIAALAAAIVGFVVGQVK